MDFSDVEETFVLLSGGELRANQPPVDKWRAATCSACLGSSVWRGGVSVYPPSSTLPDPHADMPSDAAVLYREAKDVLPHSRRAGAALARASLERLVKTLDPEAGLIPLDRRIARLETRVSSSLWELLTVLRHVGNKAVHVEEQSDELVAFYLDEEDGTELAEAMFDAINELVDELVTKPSRVRSYFDRLPAGVRESALGKLGKKD
ncbi:hypothetical protein C5E11_00760 [Clavibacter michiganensis]|nr:DUF4145 domain-containing protein [Clavibacter michiganensis]PPF65451.1 hypothetical protein C5E11_00760 [Clavibacter michiganensis]